MNDLIYSSIDLERAISVDQQEAQAVKDFFIENKEKFIKAKDISEELGIKKSETQVKLRKIITHLIENENFPIVANEKGFCHTTDFNRLIFYAEQKLYPRIQGIERRRNKILKIAQEYQREQLW